MNRDSANDSAATCLVMLAHFHDVAAQMEQLQHQFGDSGTPLGDIEILKAAKILKLKARQIKIDFSKVQELPLPAIAKHVDGNYFIIAKIHDRKALIQHSDKQSPDTVSLDVLENLMTGDMFLFTKRSLLPGGLAKFDFSWFIPALLKHKKLLCEVLIASFFIQFFGLITPLFFQVIIDKVLVNQSLTTLDVLAFGLLVISVFDVALNGLRNYIFSHTTNRVDVVLGARLFNHLLRLPVAYFQARRVGDTVARVRELDTIREFITGSALTLCIDLFFTLVFFVVMYFYSPTLTLIVLGSIPFYIVLSLVVTPILRARLDEKFKRGAANQSFLVESITGIETIKSSAVEPQMQRHWENQLAAYVTASFRSMNLGNIASQAAGLINKVVTVLLLWIGASLVIQGELSVGMLIAFNMISGRVSGPILKLVQLWQDFQQAGISVQRLGDILNMPPEPGHDPNRTTLPALKGDVRFEHVTFRYQTDRPAVLNGVSLSVQAGEIVGIVGRSGSGKSTMTKLVQRLYVPESGRMLVDGVDLALVEPAWLRRQVGVVLQENFLFNRSVKDNIALSDPGASLDRVMMAAELAGAHEFILELPEGYDTSVGEQGASLSGGQKQRIAIARALLTNPKILIFDEATSALDYESEHIIQQNMKRISQGRTVFIIAHRLSTVRDADRIIVMDKGRIVEEGDHQQLVQLDGHYARLNAHQSGTITVSEKEVV